MPEAWSHPTPWAKAPEAPVRAFGAPCAQGRDSKDRRLRAVPTWVLNNSHGWRHKCSGIEPDPVYSHPYSKVDFLTFKWNFLCFSPFVPFAVTGHSWEEASPTWDFPAPAASPRGADAPTKTVQLQQLFPQIPVYYIIGSEVISPSTEINRCTLTSHWTYGFELP